MENMGLFDSGGTNESNQQKGYFFENRYAPDEDLEIDMAGGVSGSPIKTGGSPGLKDTCLSTAMGVAGINPTLSALQNAAYP
jgi:hypothetical protein